MARARKSGLECVGEIDWGTHMCQFYKTKQDLTDILVPYFCNGLKNDEFCVWVTSDFLTKDEATAAMQKAMPNFSEYLEKGQMEIFPYTDWYLKEGKFELKRVLNSWVEKHDKAINAGYIGMRVTGNPFWLSTKEEWSDFAEYEAEINNVIDDYKMLVLCTYSLDKCSSDEIIDVVANHKFGIVKRSGKWTLIENSANKRIEEALRKTESKFSDLCSSVTEGVALHEIIYDKATGAAVDYVITDVNPAFEKIMGLSAEESKGKKASELYGTGTPPYLDIYAQVSSTGKPYSFETYFPPMDKHFFISCTSFAKGKFTTVFHDVTESKKSEDALLNALKDAKQRQAEIEALLKASKSVIQSRDFKSTARIIFDSCKELLEAKSGYVALLSDDGKDNIVLFLESGGLPCSVDSSLPMPVRGLRAITYNSGKVTVENDFTKSKWSMLMPPGHMNLKNVLFAPLTVNGQTVGVMGLANKHTDFTERDSRLALAFGEIASIALINNQMMETLEEKTEKLEHYSQNLESLVEEKTKQLKDSERLAAIGATAGMVGHDIRNPLQAMISDVYLLESELTSMSESEKKDELKESLDGIEKNIDYINKIVADLQDYARQLNPEYTEIDLPDVISGIFEAISFPDNIKLSIDLKDCPILKSDPMFIKRALTNLVNNAIQAMPDGGELKITGFQKEGKVHITVSDTGIGIPEEVKPKLFTPMITTKSKGQGLGLAVVKRLIEALDGTVTFESQEGKGTKFTINIPLKT